MFHYFKLPDDNRVWLTGWADEQYVTLSDFELDEMLVSLANVERVMKLPRGSLCSRHYS